MGCAWAAVGVHWQLMKVDRPVSHTPVPCTVLKVDPAIDPRWPRLPPALKRSVAFVETVPVLRKCSPSAKWALRRN